MQVSIFVQSVSASGEIDAPHRICTFNRFVKCDEMWIPHPASHIESMDTAVSKQSVACSRLAGP